MNVSKVFIAGVFALSTAVLTSCSQDEPSDRQVSPHHQSPTVRTYNKSIIKPTFFTVSYSNENVWKLKGYIYNISSRLSNSCRNVVTTGDALNKNFANYSILTFYRGALIVVDASGEQIYNWMTSYRLSCPTTLQGSKEKFDYTLITADGYKNYYSIDGKDGHNISDMIILINKYEYAN